MPAITSLRARAEEIRAAELAKLGDLPEDERRTIESVTAQILNKLLHMPTVRMKEAALAADGAAYAEAVRHLFGLEEKRWRRCSSGSARAARGSRSPRPRSPRPSLRAAGHEIAFVPITTAGDRDRSSPFGQIGERGVFVKEIEEALLAGRIDVAVHSAKDMTSTDTDGPRRSGAYLERDDPRDALVGADAIRPGMRIGTASVRRRAQLLALEPTISVEPLRGNVDTRLRKARERGLDALVLAACGLDRLGLAGEIGLRLPGRPDAPGGRAGRARAPGARRRGGARRARRPRRDRAAASRPSGRASR